MASRRYADLADINYFDWANSMTQADPFGGVDIDSFVSSLMKGPAPVKNEKFQGCAPTFMPKLQEPECVLPAAAASCPAASEPQDADEEFNPFLSCGTCFVPVLDLSPDEHGVTVNTFGSTGVVDAVPQGEGKTSTFEPVLIRPAVDPSTQALPMAEFRQLVDCPTCFVPSSDLSPDEHGTMVNTRATRTNAALQAAIPEPEFLPYEPLEEDFLPTSPAPDAVDDELEGDWTGSELCTDNTAVGGGMSDPFTSLWDRNAYAMPMGEYASYDMAPAPADGINLGKRPSNLRTYHLPADSERYDDWGNVMEDGCGEMPMKKKRHAAMMSEYDKDDGKQAHSRNLCPRATRILKEWMTSAEHFDHPYPDEKEKLELAAKAGITTKQLTIWFTNARKRLWVPMRKRQGLPIIGFAEYRTEQKKRYIEEQQRGLKERKPSPAPAAAAAAAPAPTTSAFARPMATPEIVRVQPVVQNGTTKPRGHAASNFAAPQQYVIGNVTFDTAVDSPAAVLAKMETMAKTLSAERRELSTRMLQIEQQERSLRAAIQSIKSFGSSV